MTPEGFCRWLQGFAELTESTPTDAQWKSIREHLQLVFKKVTPPVSPASTTVTGTAVGVPPYRIDLATVIC